MPPPRAEVCRFWLVAGSREGTRGAEVLQVRCPGNSCLLSRPHETGSKSSWLSGRLSFCCLLSWLSCRRSWCLVLLSGLPVGSGRLALSSAFVLRACFFPFSKEVTTQGADPRTSLSEGRRPKDRSSGRHPQVRTIYLDVKPAIGKYITTYSFSFPPASLSPHSLRPTGRGQWKSLHVQSGLSVEVAPPSQRVPEIGVSELGISS